MRRAVLTLLATLGVVAALAVTASSTTHVAYVAGMRGLALGAVVVVLEVVNVIGTWAVITDPRTHVRVEAVIGVAAASTVTGWCGFLTYGPMGLVAPLGLLAAVHGVSRMWTTPSSVAATADRQPSDGNPTEDHTGVSEAVDTPDGEGYADVCTPELEQGSPIEETDRVADLRAHAADLGRMPGRDAVKTRYGVGSATANRLRDAAGKPALHLATGGQR